MDDKFAVIMAVTIITLIAIASLGPDAKDLIGTAMAGLFGLAVGKGMK